MAPTKFLTVIKALGFSTPYAAARAIGVSRQQAYKLASGQSNITETMQRLLAMYERHGVPEEWL